MIHPHIIKGDKVQPVRAWIICGKCNGAKHLIFPGEKTPWWYCQDEKHNLVEGQEVDVEYLET